MCPAVKAPVQTRKILQRILQGDAGWATAPPSAGEDFGCPCCQVKYSISRRQTPPGFSPSCEDCDQEFVSRDRGDWLVYDRADAPRLNPSRVANDAGQGGPSVRPRSGGGIAALRAFIEHITPALTFCGHVAYREHDHWWEIAFAEILFKRLRNLGFRNGRRSNGTEGEPLYRHVQGPNA
jgi:hypothetical protein